MTSISSRSADYRDGVDLLSLSSETIRERLWSWYSCCSLAIDDRIPQPHMPKFPMCKHHSPHVTRLQTLPLPDVRPRSLVASAHGIVRPQQTSIIRLVCARERDQRAGCAVAAPSNLDLGARQIELRSAGSLRLMERNTLHTHEVLAAGHALGDGELDALLVWDQGLATARA